MNVSRTLQHYQNILHRHAPLLLPGRNPSATAPNSTLVSFCRLYLAATAAACCPGVLTNGIWMCSMAVVFPFILYMLEAEIASAREAALWREIRRHA
jgi:hypothetical protein